MGECLKPGRLTAAALSVLLCAGGIAGCSDADSPAQRGKPSASAASPGAPRPGAHTTAATGAGSAITGPCAGSGAKPAVATGGTGAAIDYAKWSAGRSTPVKDTLYPERGNPAVDVLHYDLALAWAPSTTQLTGTATINLRAAADQSQISLDFSCALTIDQLTVDGTPASASRTAADKLQIQRALKKESYATVVVKYHGTPQPLSPPSRRGDSQGLGLTVGPDRELTTVQEPYGALTWYPANEQPADKALYDIAVTAPPGWKGVATGTPAASAGATQRFSTTDPVSSYLTTLAVGRFTKETATGPRGIPLTYWYHKGPDDLEMKAVRQSPKYLAWLEKKFGPYPFPSAGAVIVNVNAAMETQQLVTMGQARPTDTEVMRYAPVLLHEYAHQWFGDAVGPRTWSDVWLNEGWATYAETLYTFEGIGAGGDQIDMYLSGEDEEARGPSGPPGSPKADDFGATNVYYPPAFMLRQIHNKVGDDAFFAMARGWVQANKNGSGDRASFIAHVNKSTGQDFTSLINTWLDSYTTPKTS